MILCQFIVTHSHIYVCIYVYSSAYVYMCSISRWRELQGLRDKSVGQVLIMRRESKS